MKQYTILIDCPDGWEPVAYGIPKCGQYFLSADLKAHKCHVSDLINHYLIVKKIHVWPDWLKPGWVAVDECGDVYWHKSEPIISDSRNKWISHTFSNLDCVHLDLPSYNSWLDACWEVKHEN